MGATSSKVEEDKALQLCRERKKFVGRALDGRCSLAATHFTYIESLTIIGNALKRFIEPEAPMESSLYTSNSATPEPLTFIEKSLSQLSFSSSMSQHVGAAGNRSPSPSPPTSNRYHANHMKIRGSFSRKVEERPSVPVMGSITSSSTPMNNTHPIDEPEIPSDATPVLPETQPWDYFGLPHPIDNDFSSQEARELNQGLENYTDMQRPREDEGVPEMEDKEEKSPSQGSGEAQESEDEFDEPSTDGLIRSFANVNRIADNVSGTALPSMSSAESMTSQTEILNGDKCNSPQLSPLKRKSSGVSNVATPQDEKIQTVKEGPENKAVPKDLISSMRDIEHLFIRASECGREVPRMLEANKLHFRPIFPEKERGSFTSKILKACLACGDDPSQVQEGSHASTLDRLYAWEKKLYDEVKANQMIKKVYDQKRKLLRELESNGESSSRIDKTRAIVKDLHWRIGVAIHRIDSISRRIEDLRDKELHPQLEELIEGLRRMWEVMHECHKSQFLIIAAVQNNAHTKVLLQSDSGHQITVYLESELSTLSSSFTKWIGAQKAYVQSLDGWLHKCVPLQQSTRKKRRNQPSLRDYGPPIYVTCGVWLDKLENLPTKEVSDSIKDLAAEIDHFLPQQEKGQGVHHRSMPWQHVNKKDDPAGVNLLREEVSEDRNVSFDRLRSRLEAFLAQLSKFSGLSVEMFTDLQKAIQEKKSRYAQIHSQS
ncbi:nitrate regulatory gene2 protein isoform X2 [Cynara cardunculus var. scolymus]|uniref:nitrate regulatory gene2 protein isoform X2 n=1 Tax=Cynara cardunculus var. scolymus TaxID=59895 RepID=UPI000D62EB4C|nr:nitrate regulatory gene2 protein isoform X2 [Cynara cardunculus var. scolymus]